MNEPTRLHRCHACMEPWVGENHDPDNRCPYCAAAGREVPGWFKAWLRTLHVQGRLKVPA